MSDLPSVSAGDLTETTVLIDVREPDEWTRGHAVGALHIPLGGISNRFGELPDAASVVVVCHMGGRSARATAWLLDQGYDCRNLTGGMIAYAAAGLPMTSENGLPPAVD